jgi:hypothetical protein
MTVEELLLEQSKLQAALNARGKAVNPAELTTVGCAVDYIVSMRDNLLMEVEEILAVFPSTARKPWKTDHAVARSRALASLTDEELQKLREESIDALLFLLNIVLACSVDDTNVCELLSKVYSKNKERIQSGY